MNRPPWTTLVVYCLGSMALLLPSEISAQCRGWAVAATAASSSNQCNPTWGANPYLRWTFELSCFDDCNQMWMTFPSSSAEVEGQCSLWPEHRCVPFFDQYNETSGLYGVSSARSQYVFGGCQISDEAYWTDGSCSCAPPCDEEPEPELQQPGYGSPVILSLTDGRYELTAVDQGVEFDIDGGGTPDRIAWTAADSDEAFLALDRNGNGSIDSGLELFGDWTPQLPSGERNGFRALAVFDEPQNGGNGNHRLDPHDSIYPDLVLWSDRDHDGRSSPGELISLAASGLESIDLDYRAARRKDRYGNEFRYKAATRWTSGPDRPAWDVFLVIDPGAP